HVPEVELAIAELCRVTRPGGHVVGYEGNARSVFSVGLSAGVAAKRLLGRSRTLRAQRGRLGIESWVREQDGSQYVIRRLYVRPFVNEFRKNGATLLRRLPG